MSKKRETQRLEDAKNMFDETSEIVKIAKEDYENKRTKTRSALLRDHMRNKLRAYDRLHD